MSHAIQHGLIALFASALYAVGAAAQGAGSSIDAVNTPAQPDAIVLAAGDEAAPANPAPAVPASEADEGAAPETAARPEPQVDTSKKIWLGLMVISIIAAVVWLFSRNKPRTNVSQ